MVTFLPLQIKTPLITKVNSKIKYGTHICNWYPFINFHCSIMNRHPFFLPEIKKKIQFKNKTT